MKLSTNFPVSSLKLKIPFIDGLDRQVIILSLGRLASAIGTGLTIFYAPIFFVNVAGMSSTSVGLGIGCGGFFGIIGRVLGGSCADSLKVGRRGSLLIASFLLALGAAFFAITEVFWQFLLGNIFTGLGIGFYWPAAEAFISDITKPKKLNEAFALTRLCDYIGLGLGVVLGGLLIGYHSAYRLLFVLDSLSYLVLFGFVLTGLKETLLEEPEAHLSIARKWLSATKDSKLVIYAILNLVFTNNILQMSSTLPLYFSNFVSHGDSTGFDTTNVSTIFAIYIVMISILVMPLARLTATTRKTKVLVGACVFWIIAHSAIAYLGTGCPSPFIVALGIVAAFSIANALYGPSASSLVVEISPPQARATYLSINSLCWGIAGSFGPAIGLSFLDHGAELAVKYWAVLAIINVIAIFGLLFLNRLIKSINSSGNANQQVNTN